MLPVAILAGGLATRLRPITETIPKALVDVAGKPFIVHQLCYLRQQGITHIVLCIGYLGEMVRDVVGSGERFGLKVSYSEDGPNLLGTGGALTKATTLLGSEFFVLYGDSFLPVNFSVVQEAYKQSKQPALMTVLKNQNQWDKSNVLFVNGKLIEYNKRAPRAEMSYIDYGLGVVSASVLNQRPVGQSFDLADVYQDLSLQGLLTGLEVHERFYEIGSHTGLKEAEEYFLKKD
jgi:NDP-sugar pyrophosphorylase family protein